MSLTPAEREALVRQFERDGYVLVPGVVPSERVNSLRDYLLPVLSTLGKRPAFLNDLYVQHPALLDTLAHPRLMEALDAILGENWVLLPESSASWEGYNELHTDTTSQEHRGQTFHHDPDFRMVTTGMYLQDNTKEYGGGLFLVPGSQHKPDPILKLRLAQEKYYKQLWKRVLKKLSFGKLFTYGNYEARGLGKGGIDVPTRPGDVIIFDVKILHRASHGKLKNIPPNGGKLALFSRCSRNNRHASAYMEYLKSKANGYDYLLKPRDLSAIEKSCAPYNVKVL